MEEEKIIRERKEKLARFFKEKYSWLSYVVLAFIVYLAVQIRTINIPGLRDITTGKWTLAQDLDPFLFLRWAKYIVAHGAIMANDTMRYVPIGFNVKEELLGVPYTIAWFHKLAVVFGSTSVEQSAVIFPVFMFALTVIAFFLLARKMFIESFGELNSNIIALISSFFLSVIPSLLPRTIAGIPEKESAAFLFLFLALYFFLSSWKAKTTLSKYSFALLSGISTAAMAAIWGGYTFIFAIISVSVFFAFMLGQIDKEKFYIYSVWLFSSFLLMMPLSTRYSLNNLLTSTITGASVIIFFVLLVHLIIVNTKIKTYLDNSRLSRIPLPILSLCISAVVGLAGILILFGPNTLMANINDVIQNLIRPITTRLGVTVAENRQPFFNEWAGSFGPDFHGIPILFWLFFIGSIYLFSYMMKIFNKKERIVTTLGYTFFLIAIIFSRYSSTSSLNGENSLSLILYGLGFIILLGTFGFFYYQYYKNKEENKLKDIDFGLLSIFAFFFFGVVAARGSVRTIMLLVPPISIIVSYFIVALFNDTKKVKDDFVRFICWVLVAIIILGALFAGYQYYNASKSMASYNVKVPLPGYQTTGDVLYSQQWEKAMAWVRENTSENAVFGHWWDYGYWLQTLGERATVLDGGNLYPYWDHLMGRHALTGTNNMDALEFLYAHNTTHFLIDSTDIGKYSAFSSIGSNENYDRTSYIQSFIMNNQQTQETKNSTLYIYQGGFGLDADIIYYQNETKVFLPAGIAGLYGIIIEKNKTGELVRQPTGIFVYQNKRYDIPLRYAFDHKFIDFGSGIEAGVFFMPVLNPSAGALQIVQDGSLLYLSNRTVKSQLARLYLYKEDNPYFKLVHSEEDFIVSEIKSANKNFTDDFVYYNGIRGPIRIWEINYPQNITFRPEYVETQYPDINLSIAK